MGSDGKEGGLGGGVDRGVGGWGDGSMDGGRLAAFRFCQITQAVTLVSPFLLRVGFTPE